MTQITSFPAFAVIALMSFPWASAHAAEAVRYDCSLMAQDIGSPVTEMQAAPDEGWQHGPDEARLVCSWYTDAGAKAVNGQTLSREDYKDVGVLTGQVVVYDAPLERDGAAMMNAAHDVPAGLAPDGAWLFSLKPLELNAKIGILAPELMYDGIGVSVGYGNGFVTATGTGGALTTGWSVEAAARIMAQAAVAR